MSDQTSFVDRALNSPHASKWLILLLALPVLMIYGNVGSFEYINLDDPEYVYENTALFQGLTPDSILWALTTGHSGVWAPLTWLSFLTEVELFGLNPGISHWINVLLHFGNSTILFFLLRRFTSSTGKSFFIALLFAIHPLNVESVAWVTERKDVLSTFFGFMCLYFYTGFQQQTTIKNYLLTFALFICAISSKPMMVTLPFLMLLMDFTPLQQIAPRKWKRALLEKVPFFTLSMLVAVLTYFVQVYDGAAKPLTEIAFSERLAATITNYGTYLYKIFAPVNLSVFYPYKGMPAITPIAGSLLIIISLLALAWRLRVSKPYLLFGLLWFLISLLPVSGIISFGHHSTADRFTYIAMIGVLIAVIWFLDDLPSLKNWLHIPTILAIAILTLISHKQAQQWQNSFFLFNQAIANTEDNYLAYNNLGYAYMEKDQHKKAISFLKKSIEAKPEYSPALNNLGVCYDVIGQSLKAKDYYQQAIEVNPSYAQPYINLADMLADTKIYTEAEIFYKIAKDLSPENERLLNNFAAMYIKSSQFKKAEAVLLYANSLSPNNPYIARNLGATYLALEFDQDAINYLTIAQQAFPEDKAIKDELTLAKARLSEKTSSKGSSKNN